MSEDFGIQKEGFVRKSLDEIVTEKEDATRAVFGPDVNLAPQSPEGQVNQNSALSDDQLWQIAEESYNSTDPDKSTGISLSNLVKINRITRLGDEPTSFAFVGVGTPNLTVPAGQLVSNGAELQAVIPTAFTFDGTGNASVAGELTQTGPIPVSAGTITTIDTPVTGWDTINNPVDGIEGRDREEDGELRLRRANSTAASSQNLIESLIGAVGNVSGVTTLTVLENDLDPVDANGVPGHSFEVIVTGGLDVEIGDAIWANKPFGIGSFGSTNVVIIDSQGIGHPINFTRPTQIPIFVDITLTKRPNYPADGDDQIKQAILDYASGDLVAGRGFSVNQDVIFSQLYTPINIVPGHDIDDLRIGFSASPTGEVNLTINLREVSQFLIANINIL